MTRIPLSQALRNAAALHGSVGAASRLELSNLAAEAERQEALILELAEQVEFDAGDPPAWVQINLVERARRIVGAVDD